MFTKVYQVKYTIASFWNFGISSALILWRQCKKRTSFKTLISKKATIWRLKESQSNKKRLQKTMTSSYEMEQKTFIEASCVYHINTGGKVLCSCYFWRFVSFFFCYSVKKNPQCTIACTSLLCISKEETTKQIQFMRSKFDFLHEDI